MSMSRPASAKWPKCVAAICSSKPSSVSVNGVAITAALSTSVCKFLCLELKAAAASLTDFWLHKSSCACAVRPAGGRAAAQRLRAGARLRVARRAQCRALGAPAKTRPAREALLCAAPASPPPRAPCCGCGDVGHAASAERHSARRQLRECSTRDGARACGARAHQPSTTVAPFSAKRLAVSKPRPEFAPVTSAVLPRRSGALAGSHVLLLLAPMAAALRRREGRAGVCTRELRRARAPGTPAERYVARRQRTALNSAQSVCIARLLVLRTERNVRQVDR